jgi:hypothetical protein
LGVLVLAESKFAGAYGDFSTFDPGPVRDRSGFGSLLIRFRAAAKRSFAAAVRIVSFWFGSRRRFECRFQNSDFRMKPKSECLNAKTATTAN